MTIIHAHIASAVELLERTVVVGLVLSLVADQIVVRHGSLIAIHPAAQSAPPSVQRTAALARRAHGQGRSAVRPAARVHLTLPHKHQILLRVTDMRIMTEVLCVFLGGLVRQLAGHAVMICKKEN